MTLMSCQPPTVQPAHVQTLRGTHTGLRGATVKAHLFLTVRLLHQLVEESVLRVRAVSTRCGLPEGKVSVDLSQPAQKVLLPLFLHPVFERCKVQETQQKSLFTAVS